MNKHIDWIKNNLKPEFGDVSEEEIRHVAWCLMTIDDWYYHDASLGDFLTAVVNNDLIEAFSRADGTNTKLMYLYPYYLYNEVPTEWRDKAKRTT